MRVVVVGAGIGGLSIAILLASKGHSVTVAERATELGRAGAGLSMWPNAVRVLETLGLREAIEHVGTRLTESAALCFDGSVILEMPLGSLTERLGRPALAVHRADLHRVLCSRLQDVAGTHALELGHELVSLEQHNRKVTLLFADGVTHTAELVVGADGIHSTVREALFEKSPLRYAGYVAWRGVADGLADSVPRARLTEAWGRGARFGVVPINAHQTYWFATQNVFSGLSCSPEETEAELGQLFGGWAAPIPALIAATPREQILRNDVIDRAPMRGWSRGRVVLLGDAIHSTTPNMGQGAAMALESAWVLADQLDEDSVEASLVAYEQRRTKRTAWVTRQSAWLGRVGQLENGLARWLRDAVSRTTPHSIIYKQLMLSMGYDVTHA